GDWHKPRDARITRTGRVLPGSPARHPQPAEFLPAGAPTMTSLYDAEALRPLSVFAPNLRVLTVTVQAEPKQVAHIAHKRAAEVILVPRRPDGDILLVRRAVYPPELFRLA